LRALQTGRSLLPAGVTGTLGRFEAGETISVMTTDGVEVARGVAAYSDVDTAKIMGAAAATLKPCWAFVVLLN
jgi:glutamate 5-kinase